jgi:hypothetical protein
MEDTKKSSKFLPLLLLLITVMTGTTICLCGLAWQVVRYRCLPWTCVPARSFTALDLDIPEKMYPANAPVGTLVPLSDIYPAIEAVHKTVFWNQGDGQANYIVQRFSQVSSAPDEYSISLRRSTGMTNERVIDIQNLNADKFMLQCGLYVDNTDRCRFVGLYQEYVIGLTSNIDQEMTEQDYLDIVYFIDEEITCRLSESCIEDNN